MGIPREGIRKNFDRDARVTFLGLKFHNCYFLGCSKFGLFFEVEKLSIIFLANWKFALLFGVAEERNYTITS